VRWGGFDRKRVKKNEGMHKQGRWGCKMARRLDGGLCLHESCTTKTGTDKKGGWGQSGALVAILVILRALLIGNLSKKTGHKKADGGQNDALARNRGTVGSTAFYCRNILERKSPDLNGRGSLVCPS